MLDMHVDELDCATRFIDMCVVLQLVKRGLLQYLTFRMGRSIVLFYKVTYFLFSSGQIIKTPAGIANGRSGLIKICNFDINNTHWSKILDTVLFINVTGQRSKIKFFKSKQGQV